MSQFFSRRTKNSSLGYDEEDEIKLFESSREREYYDNLADLYTVILATEHLERAFARDAITRMEVGRFEKYYKFILSAFLFSFTESNSQYP